MYRVGFPGWKLAARFGVPLLFRVNVIYDREALVYVATSPDLQGLVAEAGAVDELFPAVYDCAQMLMEEMLRVQPKARPLAAWTGVMQPA